MRMQPWYFHLIEVMVACPMMDKKELAEELGVSFATVVYVTNSDLFKFHLEERRKEIRQQTDAVITHRLSRVADKSLSLLQDILEEKGKAIPLPQLAELSHNVLTKLGYGASTEGRSAVQVNVNGGATQVIVPVSASDLAEARAALRRSEEMRVIETATVGRSAAGYSSYKPNGGGVVEVESNHPIPSDEGVSVVEENSPPALLPLFDFLEDEG